MRYQVRDYVGRGLAWVKGSFINTGPAAGCAVGGTTEEPLSAMDYVRVAPALTFPMRHFPEGCDAIVQEYHEGKYSLYLKGMGPCSWFSAKELALIEHGRPDLLQEWEAAAEERRAQAGDLDWIFANGLEVSERPALASLQRLGECLGITDLWGGRKDAQLLYLNREYIQRLAEPYLLAGDKAGWLAFAARQGLG